MKTVEAKGKNTKYFEAVGRRKTSVARVRLEESGKQSLSINNRELAGYFPLAEQQAAVLAPLSDLRAKFKVSVKVKGGGVNSQAEAVRHGIARGLTRYDETLRKGLKSHGYLKRDPRMKERRKFGLKKARKAAQWSKR